MTIAQVPSIAVTPRWRPLQDASSDDAMRVRNAAYQHVIRGRAPHLPSSRLLSALLEVIKRCSILRELEQALTCVLPRVSEG